MSVPNLFYSVIYWQSRADAPDLVNLGVVLFSPEGPLIRLTEAPHQKVGDQARIMMALRAMVNRLREADVRSAMGIQAFANRQANEIRLTAPQQVEASSPDVTLDRLEARELWD